MTPHDDVLQPLLFDLELQDMRALLTVLTHLARLGAQVTHIHASANAATIALLVRAETAHRFAPQLDRIVEVIRLTPRIPLDPHQPHSL
jgi:hypothetical protein